jgi:hypothetical protein
MTEARGTHVGCPPPIMSFRRSCGWATLSDQPFQIIAKCKHCGRAKNQHRAVTLECPKGKRTPRGYLGFATKRFAEARRDDRGPHEGDVR